VRVGSEEERAAAAGGEREEHQLLLHLAVTLTPRDDKELGGLSLQGDRRAVMFAPSLCALLLAQGQAVLCPPWCWDGTSVPCEV
jgi:hypothetical protein